MLSAPAAPAPTEMHTKRREPDDGVNVRRRDHHSDKRREDDERHDARFHQREVIADGSNARLVAGGRAARRELCAFADNSDIDPLSCR